MFWLFRGLLVVTSAFAEVDLVYETCRTGSFFRTDAFAEKPERVFGRAGTVPEPIQAAESSKTTDVS